MIWNTLSLLDLPKPLVARHIEITRQSVFYLDPHVCIRCRYSQHGAALAVPALSRVEYVRGGADRAGDGYRGGDSCRLDAVAVVRRPKAKGHRPKAP